MATKAAEAPPPAPPVERAPVIAGGRGKLIMIAAIVVALLGAAGGGAWYFTRSDDADEPVAKGKAGKKGAEKAGERGAEKPGVHKPSAFMTLDTFIVNLQEENGAHYLQTAIVFEVPDEKAIESIKPQMPVIRSKILLLLSSKLPSQLKTPEDKEKLAGEIVGEARKYLNVKSPDETLLQVHFGSFVIQ